MSNNGGVIGPNVPSFSVASGIWRPSFMARQLAAGVTSGQQWPLLADPSFSSVSLLCHCDEITPADSTLRNRGSGGAVSIVGTARQSNAIIKYGALSMNVGSSVAGQALSSPTGTGYAYGTGDFTLEFSVYPISMPLANLWDQRTGANSVCVNIYANTDGSLHLFVSNADRIASSAGALVTSKWQHIALCRSSGTTKLFIDGTQVGSNYTDSNSYTQASIFIGNSNLSNGLGGAPANAYFQECRATKGVARYTTTFTPPTTRFPDY